MNFGSFCNNCDACRQGEKDCMKCGQYSCSRRSPETLNVSNSESKLKREPKKEETGDCTMSTASDKNLKNYLYDNPELRETKIQNDCDGDFDDFDGEVWLLQCPKGFDPKSLMSTELGKAGRKMSKMGCDAERYTKAKTLAVIAPEKAAEYQMISCNVKLVKPVGKISVHEQFDASKSDPSDVDVCKSNKRFNSPTSATERTSGSDSDEQDSDDRTKPTAGSKMKKKVNNQRFTIETTVKVESLNPKKNRKSKSLDQSKYQPAVMQSSQKTMKKSKLDSDWME